MNVVNYRIPRTIIANLQSSDVCWAVVDRIWPVDESSEEEEEARIELGTAGQKAIYFTMLYAQEVDNGGIKQFFSNSSGYFWKGAAEGFKLLGAREHIEIFQLAVKAFPNGMPSADQSTRQTVVNSLSNEQQDQWISSQKRIYQRGGFFNTLQP